MNGFTTSETASNFHSIIQRGAVMTNNYNRGNLSPVKIPLNTASDKSGLNSWVICSLNSAKTVFIQNPDALFPFRLKKMFVVAILSL